MRVLIQRVDYVRLLIEGKLFSEIGKGLLILVGVEDADSHEDVEKLVKKITQLRIFDDENGVMNLDVQQVSGDIMAVSQFTLHASTKKGNRPSYIKAAKEEIAKPLYEDFKKSLSIAMGKPVACGIFGTEMKIELLNSGPVTIWIDTKEV